MHVFLLFFGFSSAFAESQAGSIAEAPTGGVSINLLEALLSANIIVQLTFLVLIAMSVVSWAIIFQKWIVFKKVKQENEAMEDVFSKASSFEEIQKISQSHTESPLSQIFINAYNEMKKSSKKESDTSYELTDLDTVERSLRKTIDNEISHLEVGLGFLATTGSSCPFIGLFGTVFGIMNSFNKIAAMGSASLNVVAPGIAEALLATGVGLFAAIPASIFFNNFLNEIKKQELICNNFSTDFLNIAKRNFLKN
ncbi:MAG: protein TolQ [Bdellovibrionales bacterium]